MIVALLVTLFVSAALVAIFSMLVSLRRYGRSALKIADQLRDCPELRDFPVRTRTVEVRSQGASILRPRFTPRRSAIELPAAA